MLPGATGAFAAELAAFTIPPGLMESVACAHAHVTPAISHTHPARRMLIAAHLALIQEYPKPVPGARGDRKRAAPPIQLPATSLWLPHAARAAPGLATPGPPPANIPCSASSSLP